MQESTTNKRELDNAVLRNITRGGFVLGMGARPQFCATRIHFRGNVNCCILKAYSNVHFASASGGFAPGTHLGTSVHRNPSCGPL